MSHCNNRQLHIFSCDAGARIILFHYYLLTFCLCATESIISTRMEKLAEEYGCMRIRQGICPYKVIVINKSNANLYTIYKRNPLNLIYCFHMEPHHLQDYYVHPILSPSSIIFVILHPRSGLSISCSLAVGFLFANLCKLRRLGHYILYFSQKMWL